VKTIGDRARLRGHDLGAGTADGGEVGVAHVAAPRAGVKVAAFAQAHEERFEPEGVACGDEVDRVAHEGQAHGFARLDQARKLLVPEPAQARPQADVGEVGGLGLHADEVLDRRRGGYSPALEKELPREERAVQRGPVENLLQLGHRAIVLDVRLQVGPFGCAPVAVDLRPQLAPALLAAVGVEEVHGGGGQRHPHHQAREPESHEHHN
jgi:hypothetical protein